MPSFLNLNEFCSNLPEITTEKIFLKKHFHPEGLYSEQIFGPLRNYTCQCGTYYGASKSGSTCTTCGVDIVSSNERRKRFAKITLPIPIVNPLFYDYLVYIGGKTIKSAIDQLMRDEKSFLYIDGEDYVVSSSAEVKEKVNYFEKVDAIYKLVHGISKMMTEEGLHEWKLVYENIDSLLLSSIIVLPPELRPISSDSSGKHLTDKINAFYTQILLRKKIMQETVLDIQRDKKLYYTYFRQLQKDINELYQHILEKLSKKKGLIRGNILGKRIDFSGRAVIVPDPTLSIDECCLPYVMVLELYKLQIAKKLIEKGKFKLLNQAIDCIDYCIDFSDTSLLPICEEVIKDEYCLLNRQPSLHRLSLLGYKIKITTDKVIKVHPLICHPYNADFDGDQMAVYIPVTEDAKKEIQEKIIVSKNFSSPANESLTTRPNQDVILGIYFLTQNEKTRKIFNECLPEDYPPVNEVVDSSKLFSIIEDIKDRYEIDVVKRVLDDIKRLGFKYATIHSPTMSLDEFHFECESLKDKIYKKPSVREQLVAVNSDEILSELKGKFSYSYMIESGARGSWDQARQIVLTRGFISNFDGEILPTPIKHSLCDGLEPEEFFNSTYGCRKGLLDVAINTGVSGYLSRKLIFTCVNLQLGDEEDCGTKDLLGVFVKNERKAKMLINRYCLNGDKLEKITIDNYKNLVNKKIYIRSPILCENEKVCKICYGDLHKTVQSRFIGVVAAQTLGERATQLVLRTFHTSGVATIKGEKNNEESLKQEDIIGDLSSIYKLLHKFDGEDYEELVDKLFDIYDKDIYHVHFECVVSQLMWYGYRKWRLLPNRKQLKPTYLSIQNVPSRESWILAMAFSNPKRALLHGFLYQGNYSGVLDQILKGKIVK